MNPFHTLKYPAKCRSGCRLIDLVRKCVSIDKRFLIRRCTTEYNNSARVITISKPSIRDGFLTNNDDTKKTGDFRKLNPRSTEPWPLYPLITSTSDPYPVYSFPPQNKLHGVVSLPAMASPVVISSRSSSLVGETTVNHVYDIQVLNDTSDYS